MSHVVTERVPGAMAGVRVAGLIKLVAALLLLNVSLTFSNIWPTLGIGLNADLSLETAVCVLALLAARRWWNGPSAVGLRWLAGLWLVLVVGRYAEVTVTSLYGRNINLYWDLQHVPSVGAMFAVVADPWLKAGVVVGLVLGLVSLYLGARWSLGVVASAAREPSAQRGLGALAVVVLGLSLAQPLGTRIPGVRVASPVAMAYARELGEFAYELSGAGMRDLGPPPVLRSDLSRLGGADVFVIFLESYGAVAWQRPELADPLVAAMTRLDADIAETGRFVASALVESTTFGGESWLAHVSLLSGTEIRDPATNVRLMAQERDTMVKLFGRQGYRTVAIMPGMLVAWPEGAFYGFEEIYDHEGLDYRGPQFGWWDVNDQYALARVDALEIEPTREQPAFVFFTTISTHAPFVPAPPYQADWARVLTTDPYDAEALDRAWSAWPDWTNLGPSYLEAIEYALSNIGGYLRLRADRDLVMVLVGDHQPPALVSGEGASWDVPVHVIANRPAVLDRLTRHHQFTNTLQPGDQAVARMDTLLPILLDAFGDGGGP
ncbi:MAG: hypothetical protein CL482_14205 [Acidobacteria bacterium]|nr:hypothetical protein [Acidobacteriota bacterium]